MSGHFVANEWATLRKYYKQNIRGKSRGGDRSESGIVKSKWKFYKDLMFLEESATAEPSLLLTDIISIGTKQFFFAGIS
ncbi:hypothetical protein QR680_016115 [Steinernema hermaphroditum]|uniref:MADF domain-containing protein n=1 Tax=Steinernema hermaphroditum TaxID=289476 RepID=A0AA39LLE8_9BILA|nr:hypothetical protein QR680_016115 [Steinernema hermaphroditum]